MNKIFIAILLFSITVLLIGAIFNAPFVQAINLQDNLKQTGGTAYYDDSGRGPGETDPAVIVGNIIKIALSLIGVLFTILILVSGYQWMTAGGNAETITKSKQRIVNAVIGLGITLAVFGLTTFIMSTAFSITGI
jgi:Type IV secretion system pilin